MTSDEYPDALGRLWSAVSCPHAGDVLVSPVPGYEFVDWGGSDHVGGGSHGSLQRDDSEGVLLVAGMPVPARRAVVAHRRYPACAGALPCTVGPMSDDGETTVASHPHRVHVRVRAGLAKSHNWLELAKFCAVGGSGYVVNLGVFALCVEVLGMHHLVAATCAFLVAVMNNFWWNRRWTFAGARGGRAGFQAARFLAVSVRHLPGRAHDPRAAGDASPAWPSFRPRQYRSRYPLL